MILFSKENSVITKRKTRFMKFSQIILFIVLFFFSFTYIYAQTDDLQKSRKSEQEVELEDKGVSLLTDIVGESTILRLPENRMLVYITAGNLLWKRDQKLARSLFRNAADEFIQFQNLPKGIVKSEMPDYRFYISNNLRGQMIYSLSGKDAKFALEILYLTRLSETAEAVQMYQQTVTNTGKNPDFSEFKQEERNKLQIAKNEIETEQKIKREIDKDDPQKLSENIRESFAKDIGGYQILLDLEKLNKTDHDLAQKLLNEIMSKLAQSDFSIVSGKDMLTFFVYARFLNLGKQNTESDEKYKELKFDEKSVKAIASNEFDYLQKRKPSRDSGNTIQKIIYLKEVLPERLREIEKLYENAKQLSGNPEWIESMIASSKLGANPILEQIIKNSPKLNSHDKERFYRNAIAKLLETENPKQIAQKLEQIPDAEEKEKVLDYLKSLVLVKSNENKSLPDAVAAINQIKSEKERISKLIDLAVVYHQKNTEEDQKNAEELMNKAQRLVKTIPETSTEYEEIVPVIWGYSKISSQKTFDLLEPIIQKSNKIIEAYILYMNFNDRNYPYVSENEINFASQDGYTSIKSKYINIAKSLAQIDFERTMKTIDNFQNAEVRLIAKLILAEGILLN